MPGGTSYSRELGDGLLTGYEVDYVAGVLVCHVVRQGSEGPERWSVRFDGLGLFGFRRSLPGVSNVVADLEQVSSAELVAQFGPMLEDYRGHGLDFTDRASLIAALEDGERRAWCLSSSAGVEGFVLAGSCTVTRVG